MCTDLAQGLSLAGSLEVPCARVELSLWVLGLTMGEVMKLFIKEKSSSKLVTEARSALVLTNFMFSISPNLSCCIS